MKNLRQKGFSLVEALVGVTILAFVVASAASFFRAGEYAAIKARIDGRIAALTRYHSEKLLYMPYSALIDATSRGGMGEAGYLYHPANRASNEGLFPYQVTTTLALSYGGTANEQVSISTTIRWEEPSPDFSQAANIQKEVHLGTHTRRKF